MNKAGYEWRLFQLPCNIYLLIFIMKWQYVSITIFSFFFLILESVNESYFGAYKVGSTIIIPKVSIKH